MHARNEPMQFESRASGFHAREHAGLPRATVLLRASSIGVDMRVTPLDPPDNPEAAATDHRDSLRPEVQPERRSATPSSSRPRSDRIRRATVSTLDAGLSRSRASSGALTCFPARRRWCLAMRERASGSYGARQPLRTIGSSARAGWDEMTATPGQATTGDRGCSRPSERLVPTQDVIVLARNRPPSKRGALS